MESGKKSNRRSDLRGRSRTVSGAIPDLSTAQNENEDDTVPPVETMRFPWSSPSAPTSPISPERPQTAAVASPKSSSGHKRNFSGNIFSKLNFLNRSGEDGGVRPSSRGEQRLVPVKEKDKDKEPISPTKSLFSRKSVEGDAPSPTSPSKEKEGPLSAALKQQSKTRKRKGSLRKTALLGGGGKRIVSEGRERKGSFGLLQRSGGVAKQLLLQQQQATSKDEQIQDAVVVDSDELANSHPEVLAQSATRESPGVESRLQRQFSYENPVAASSSDGEWTEPAAVSATRLALLTEHQKHAQVGRPGAGGTMADELGSPLDVKSPTSQASTTDDDDILTFERVSKPPAAPTPPLSPTATSYFPSVDSSTSTFSTRRSSKRRSPLSRTLPLTSTSTAAGPYTTASPEYHDYTSTETWGWTLLFVTWLTFTVGMGSCLEIWSWAWDVGETPYAPPELEDDPTLPIVGYYPALMVLTGVVAWVWITVAWVGMKYFRHAKIEV